MHVAADTAGRTVCRLGTARRRGGEGGRGRKKSQGRDALVAVKTEEDGTGLSGREEWRKR